MKNKSKTRPILLISVLVLLLTSTYYIRKFTPAIQKHCSDKALAMLIEQSEKNADTPSFIGSYWPAEAEKITLYCYILATDRLALRRGVGVTLETFDIAEYEILKQNNNNVALFTDRISLYIDGNKVPDSSKAITDNIVELFAIKDGVQYSTGISTGYKISWTPLLLPGKHTAKVVIHTKSGKTFEFEWGFSVSP